eukprot:11210636-Lingulodinium_polyedra.AAC.1
MCAGWQRGRGRLTTLMYAEAVSAETQTIGDSVGEMMNEDRFVRRVEKVENGGLDNEEARA